MLRPVKNKENTLILSGKSLLKEETPFQSLEIFQETTLGVVLVLDDDAQIAEVDFYRYQESLVHPALLLHPDPQVILVLGGGDGLFQNELQTYPRLKRVDWVEIDERVYPNFKTYGRHLIHELPPSVLSPFIQDGLAWIHHPPRAYDAVFLDLVDPLPVNALTQSLFHPSTLQELSNLLTPSGVVTIQTGDGQGLSDLLDLLSDVFEWVLSYSVETSLQPQSFLACGNSKKEPLSTIKLRVIQRYEERQLKEKTHFWTPELWNVEMRPARKGEK